jgi:hypothetical protein
LVVLAFLGGITVVLTSMKVVGAMSGRCFALGALLGSQEWRSGGEWWREEGSETVGGEIFMSLPDAWESESEKRGSDACEAGDRGDGT